MRSFRVERRRELLVIRCAGVTRLDAHAQQPRAAAADLESAEVSLQSRRLEIPVDREDAQAAARQQDRDVGERHAAANAALVRVERDDAVHVPVNLGTFCCAFACRRNAF